MYVKETSKKVGKEFWRKGSKKQLNKLRKKTRKEFVKYKIKDKQNSIKYAIIKHNKVRNKYTTRAKSTQNKVAWKYAREYARGVVRNYAKGRKTSCQG